MGDKLTSVKQYGMLISYIPTKMIRRLSRPPGLGGERRVGMSSKPISLSAGEWQVMECLWEASPRTLMEMVHALSPATGWSKSTIVTMVTRLEAKGAVAYSEGGRARLYSPTITREQAAAQETETLLRRVYRGSVGLMVNALVDSRGLTQADIDELTAILEKAKEG